MTKKAADRSLAQFYESRSAVYRDFGNGSLLDVVHAVLPEGGRLLDVGCASGGLLAGTRARAGYSVGIELSPSAAAQAGAFADRVIVGDVADPALLVEPAGFDVVVLADVLEHVVEPRPVLERAATWCSPSGTIVISVPNIAHWAARWSVLRGTWEYTDSGTFDRGHLRFFTRTTIERLVVEAGLTVGTVLPVVPALRNHVPALSRLAAPRRRRVEAWWQQLGRRRPEMLGYQLLVLAHRSDRDQ